MSGIPSSPLEGPGVVLWIGGCRKVSARVGIVLEARSGWVVAPVCIDVGIGIAIGIGTDIVDICICICIGSGSGSGIGSDADDDDDDDVDVVDDDGASPTGSGLDMAGTLRGMAMAAATARAPGIAVSDDPLPVAAE
jgi:hypothetical protein